MSGRSRWATTLSRAALILRSRLAPEAGPENPMGTRAMNPARECYRTHGIGNVAKIGRRDSNGYFGLFNHHVETLL